MLSRRGRACIYYRRIQMKPIKTYGAWINNEQVGQIRVMEDRSIVVDTNYGFDVTEEQCLQAEWVEEEGE